MGVGDKMNYSLNQIRNTLKSMGVKTDCINSAIKSLKELLRNLDDVEVKGRKNVDMLLGCMMALEAIIGEEVADG